MAREKVTFLVELDIETDANEPGWEADGAYMYALASAVQDNGWQGAVWRKGRARNRIVHAGDHGLYET